MNLPDVWNAAPARSPVSMAPSNGNTPGVVSVSNIALDDGKKSSLDNAVALIRYRPDMNSLTETLNLCQGLQGISANAQILNKPKSISWRDTNQSRNLIQRIFSKGENNGI